MRFRGFQIPPISTLENEGWGEEKQILQEYSEVGTLITQT